MGGENRFGYNINRLKLYRKGDRKLKDQHGIGMPVP